MAKGGVMLKKALTGTLNSIRRSGVPAAFTGEESLESEELGQWHYLVTDLAGIRLRMDACYSKESKCANRRIAAGTVVQVDKRRRSGWTRWLSLASGEGWLFDISPKNRKVRMVEVEVQQGEWWYQVYIDQLPVLPRPQLGAGPVSPPLHLGDMVTAVERVRPLIGRGAFLKLAGINGWVLDFADGAQTLMRVAEEDDDRDETLPRGPAAFGATAKGPDDAFGEPEFGEWTYIVLDPRGMTLRGRPTYDKGAKISSRLEEGELVTVVERQSGASTVFLRVDFDGHVGWAFDRQPGSSSAMRMMEVQLDQGNWFYRIVSDRGCALRSRCSTSESSKVGPGPEKGALVRIGQRAKVGGTTFLRLQDGAGWIFDHRDAKTVAEGPVEVQTMRKAHATVCTEDAIFLHKAPTNESWARTNMVVLPNAKVQVSFKAYIEGDQWMEVSKPGGMEGWVPADVLEFEFAVTNVPGWARGR
mmetsp:Transcript_35900/g.101051  ORF Transcript_35900/g.101051 Transcript_35900/m.101051 type:complete len:472 (+) Transcript_35900:141-1556(+)